MQVDVEFVAVSSKLDDCLHLFSLWCAQRRAPGAGVVLVACG